MQLSRIERRLLGHVGRASEEYGLIEPGDRIMVAVSGGKDSYALLHLLRLSQRRVPFAFEIVAVHLDQGQPGYDGAPLEQWLQDEGYDYKIVRRDTYSVVTDKVAAGKTTCSLCSRLRRGILYTTAVQLGATKIALGHHRDDVIETLLLNLLFSGQIKAMPPRLRSDDGRNVVIRPLIRCAESELVAFAEERRFPILPCNLCGSQPNLERQQIKQLLNELSVRNANVKGNLFAALSNIRPSHLLDRNLRRAMGIDEAVGPDESVDALGAAPPCSLEI